jgi:transcriptional regulator with XRE-family HTH domain
MAHRKTRLMQKKTSQMSYVTQVIAASLRDARTAKGLSQRDLSALAGIPQAQISRIEAGTVDPRVTSLIAIANALDLELALVPRKAVPAVKSIVRQSGGHADPTRGLSQKEITRIAETLSRLQVAMPNLDGVMRLQKTFVDLQRFQLPALDPETLRALRKSLERIEVPNLQIEALTRSQDAMQKLRNQLAHQSSVPPQDASPRPAYSLDDDDA